MENDGNTFYVLLQTCRDLIGKLCALSILQAGGNYDRRRGGGGGGGGDECAPYMAYTYNGEPLPCFLNPFPEWIPRATR